MNARCKGPHSLWRIKKKKKKKRISLKWDVEEGLFLCLNSIQGIEISAVKQYSLFSLLL